MLSKTKLSTEKLVATVFVRYGTDIAEAVKSMPRVGRYSADKVGKYAS